MTLSLPPTRDSCQLPYADNAQPSHKGEVFFLCDEAVRSPSSLRSSSPSDIPSLHSVSDDDNDVSYSRTAVKDSSHMGLLPCMLAHPSLPNVFPSASTEVATVSSREDEERILLQIVLYLNGRKLPVGLVATSPEGKVLLCRAQRFFLEGDRLWRYGVKNEHPRLVVLDRDRRPQLLDGAHNKTGHHGREATYKLLTDRYWWPRMFHDVSFFVASCYECQSRSSSRPKVPFSPTQNTNILRRFDLDTISINEGSGGRRFILHAIEPAIGWQEARASSTNDSRVWADFIFQDIICHFACIPCFVTDGGTEFKGMVAELFRLYSIPAIVTSPYNPKSNGAIERAHHTFRLSVLKATNGVERDWPKFIHATLLASRVTTNRSTGYAPYYLLYGVQPIMGFEMEDLTWELNWHQVSSTSDLLGTRAMQIARKRLDVGVALQRQGLSRRRGLELFCDKYGSRLDTDDFDNGTWVWLHQTSTDTAIGNKHLKKWAGPFIIHSRHAGGAYYLMELDGSRKQGLVTRDRLKLFWFRSHHQSIRSVSQTAFQQHHLAQGLTHSLQEFILACSGGQLACRYVDTAIVPLGPTFVPPDLVFAHFFVIPGWLFGATPTLHDIAHKPVQLIDLPSYLSRDVLTNASEFIPTSVSP